MSFMNTLKSLSLEIFIRVQLYLNFKKIKTNKNLSQKLHNWVELLLKNFPMSFKLNDNWLFERVCAFSIIILSSK